MDLKNGLGENGSISMLTKVVGRNYGQVHGVV